MSALEKRRCLPPAKASIEVSIACNLRRLARDMMNSCLPPCSARDCTRAGLAVINGSLFCSEHAVGKLHKLLMPQRSDAEMRAER